MKTKPFVLFLVLAGSSSIAIAGFSNDSPRSGLEGVLRVASDAANVAGNDVDNAVYGARAEIRKMLKDNMAMSPDQKANLAAEIVRIACARGPEFEAAALAETMLVLGGEVTTPEAIDCLVERCREENAVLWRALDVWQAGQYPESAAIVRLKNRVRDKRSMIRLVSIDTAVEANRNDVPNRFASPLNFSRVVEGAE
jgi:hypothetical protein